MKNFILTMVKGGVIGLAYYVPSVYATTWYVNALNGNDGNDGLTWNTAFRTIQRGIDVASGADEVIVGDGVYAPISTSRKGFDDTITIKSQNGANKTIIDGGGSGDCAYLRNNASTWSYSTLDGFTLRNGHVGIHFGNAVNCVITGNDSSTVYRYSEGGGAISATLINCTITKNRAGYRGGGMYGGTSVGCLFVENSSNDSGGGAYGATHSNSVFRSNTASGYGGAVSGGNITDCRFENNSAKYGGAADGGSFRKCVFVGNSSSVNGGAADYGTYYECVFDGNTSTSSGGALRSGTYYGCVFKNNSARTGAGVGKGGTFYNCLLVNNNSKNGCGAVESAEMVNCTVYGNSGTTVGGVVSSTLKNCIVWNNSRSNVDACTISFSCTSPLMEGQGNIANDPMFANAQAGDFSLSELSPCIDAGTEILLPSTKDIANNPRVRNGAVDMGAYEVQSGSEYTGPTTYYVDADASPMGDGKSWNTAFREIQDAIDAAMGEDIIVVGRGRYRPIKTDGKMLTIESAFGKYDTFIDASLAWPEGITNRCATLDVDGSRTNSHSHVVNDPSVNTNTKLRGFTLVNGVAEYAGGVFSGLIEHCVISNCLSRGNGGGAYVCHMNDCKILFNGAGENGGGTYLCSLNRCLVQGNHACLNGGGGVFGKFVNTIVIGNSAEVAGGGVEMTEPINCTIVGNKASSGGGGYDIMQCENSIVWGNTLLDGVTIENYNPDEYGFWGMNCCTWPEAEGYDNVSTDPLITWLDDGTYMLDSRSPCIDRVDSFVVEDEFYGVVDEDYAVNARVQGDSVDIGAIEMPPETLTSVEVEVQVLGCGEVLGAGRYEIGDAAEIKAIEVDPFHTFEGFFVDGVEITTDVTHRGQEHTLEYKVFGASVIVARFKTAIFYVSQTGIDGNVGTSYNAARRTIQSAVDSAGNGDTIIVDDGVYGSFRVNKPGAIIEMRSANGCGNTFIDGQNLERCVYASCEKFLIRGFTIRNGNGGGIGGSFECWDSIIKDCNAGSDGGGASYGTLYNCRIEGNTAHCYGGGCYSCTLHNCVVVNNKVVQGNGYIYQIGGGMYGGRAYNCTIYGNSAAQKGGGVYHADLCNCIIIGNSAPTGPEVENRPYESGWYYATNCFSSAELHGYGNLIGNDARFANVAKGDFSLLPDSICIDSGNNNFVCTQADFCGNKRISNDFVDIGAFEFQHPEKIEDSFANIWGEWSMENETAYTVPEHISSWNELAVVAWRARDAYTRSGTLIEAPPSHESIILSLGAIGVPDSLMIGDVEYETEVENGVGVWRMRIWEDTNTCSIVARIGSQMIGLSAAPSYAATLWVDELYGKHPKYLNGAEAEEWYAQRSRCRIAWLVTLVPNSRWSEYCSNREAFATAAETAGEPPVVINGIETDTYTGIHGLSVRSLTNGAIRVFGSTDLSSTNWNYKSYSLQPRGTAMTGVYSANGSQFMKAVFSELPLDSDGDGISDVIEENVYGTNPDSVDTSGDGITDWEKVYHYGLNPKIQDTDHDGITDDEEILANTNPTIPADVTTQESLNVTIRYYYDDDDRLIGTYFGRGGGKIRTTLSPAGNPLKIEKKGE